MSGLEDKLSAFLDGELPEEEAREIELALESDPRLQAELDALMAADAFASEAFAEALTEPVPMGLAAAVRDAPTTSPANDTSAPTSRSGWLSAVAAVLFLAVGGTGGYFAGLSQNPPASLDTTPVWLADIADYHAVYSAEKRHLVEVAASEADHIKTWLTNSVGTSVTIPDLEASGLTFQGARLLVAAGKPVAQLMYTDAAGNVVALCQIRTDSPSEGVNTRTLNGFGMVSWGAGDANFVIVGPEGQGNLGEIAELASTQV